MESDSPATRFPYRILTPRLELRCYQPEDAPLLTEAISASVPHLQAWFPWALPEPVSAEVRLAILAGMIERYEKLADFTMGIFNRDGTQLLGGTGLHPRGRAVCWEIGYWVRADAEGLGYVTEASIALTQVALGLVRLPRLEIRCETRNLRSRRIPERLGFTLEGVLRHAQRDVRGALCDIEVWTLLETEYASWAHQGQEIQCFDRSGAAMAWPSPALHP